MTKGKIFILIGILVLLFIGKRLSELGAFYPSKLPFPSDSLAFITGIPGPEDMELDSLRGGIWYSSGLHCSPNSPPPSSGSLGFLSFESGGVTVHSIALRKPLDFNPHGIGLWAEGEGPHRLFVVNHRSDASQSIEVYTIKDEAQGPGLVHEQTLRSKALIWPNDVVAISPNAALVSVVSKYGKGWGKQMDAFLGLHGGFILYVDSTQSYTVAGGLAFPNGILRGKNENEIYVAETIGGNIQCFQRQEDERLKPIDKQFVHYGLDNLAWDGQGYLWAAAQSNMLALAAHIQNPKKPSPSAIFKMDTQKKAWNIQMVYQDPGTLHAGISVALPYRGKLFLGAFCKTEILTLPYPAQP